ncbi:MAG: trimethylamine methyltransferase family protein [Chloroflexota bacterium]
MSNQRASKRSARRAKRQVLPLAELPFRQPQNPYAPYELLDEEQIEQIHNASLHILENIGIDFWDDETLDIWTQAGAKVDRAARHVWLDRGIVMEAIRSAPKTFTWRARNAAHNVTIGGNHVAFGPCGGMVYVSDLVGGRRPGTQADFENFVRLSQICHVLHFASWEQVTAQDIPINQRHLQRLFAGYTLSDKVVKEAAHGRIITSDAISMARIAFGGQLPDEPVTGDVINVNSPLRFDDRMLGGLITYARAGQVTYITPFILAGAMSPITMAAALAQQNAEVLAGVTLTQLVRPGAPVLYGGFTTNTDMKSGSPAFGTPEGAWAQLVGTQLARRYQLPFRGNGSLTAAKTPDAQAIYETSWNLWPAVMGQANLVMHSVGWLDGGLTASFEKFILDLEQLAMFSHFLGGFSIDQESLALDMIAQVGPGGHHFGTEHTQARFQDAFYTSTIAERQTYDTWAAGGSKDAAERAHGIWQSLLEGYSPPPLEEAVRDELEEYVARRTQELSGTNLYD